MPTDVILDQDNGTSVVVQANALKVTAADFVLDFPQRRHSAGGLRRALVHDFNDGLTVNFASDYPGGVTINGRTININGPSGARISLDATGAIGLTNTADQVTIHGTVIHLDTLQPDGNSAGDIQITFQHPGEFDQDGNQHTPDFPETVSLGVLLSTLRDEISSLKDRVAQLESKP